MAGILLILVILNSFVTGWLLAKVRALLPVVGELADDHMRNAFVPDRTRHLDDWQEDAD